MKKSILSTLLVSGIIIGGAQSVSADNTIKTNPNHDNTKVGVTFDTDGPNKPGEGPFIGNLALVSMPKTFEFGTVSATGSVLTANAKGFGTTDDRQWLVVNDDRDNEVKNSNSTDENDVKGGTWHLTAKMTPLVSGDKTLASSLLFNLSQPISYDIGTELNVGGDDIKPAPVDPDATKFDKGFTFTRDVKLESGAATETTMFAKTEATKEKGGAAVEVKDVKLSMQAPKSVAGERFTSEVVWTLSTGLEK